MKADMNANKKLSHEMWKTQHVTCFISQSYFKVPKDISLKATYFFYPKNI